MNPQQITNEILSKLTDEAYADLKPAIQDIVDFQHYRSHINGYIMPETIEQYLALFADEADIQWDQYLDCKAKADEETEYRLEQYKLHTRVVVALILAGVVPDMNIGAQDEPVVEVAKPRFTDSLLQDMFGDDESYLGASTLAKLRDAEGECQTCYGEGTVGHEFDDGRSDCPDCGGNGESVGQYRPPDSIRFKSGVRLNGHRHVTPLRLPGCGQVGTRDRAETVMSRSARRAAAAVTDAD